MTLEQFGRHVAGINAVRPLRKLEHELDRIVQQNRTAATGGYTEEFFRGTEVERLNLLPEQSEAALEIVRDRITQLAPRFGRFHNRTWVDLTFSDGRKWTGIIESQDAEIITIGNGLPAAGGLSESATCAWTELEDIQIAANREYRSN